MTNKIICWVKETNRDVVCSKTERANFSLIALSVRYSYAYFAFQNMTGNAIRCSVARFFNHNCWVPINNVSKKQTKFACILQRRQLLKLFDASNHNEVKLFPLVIRFFSAKVKVNIRFLVLRSMPSETSEQIMNFILLGMEENVLNLQQLTLFRADNGPVNFGGSNQGRKNRKKKVNDIFNIP